MGPTRAGWPKTNWADHTPTEKVVVNCYFPTNKQAGPPELSGPAAQSHGDTLLQPASHIQFFFHFLYPFRLEYCNFTGNACQLNRSMQHYLIS
jgi:hypothetical protein